MKRFLYYVLPVILWMGVIFLLSSIPSVDPVPTTGLAHTLSRKLAHIIEYAVLTLLVIRAFQGYHLPFSFQSILQLAFFLVLLYAISDEAHQIFVGGREGTFRDVSIDAIGSALVCLCLSQRHEKKGR